MPLEETDHPLLRPLLICALEPVIRAFDRLQFRFHSGGQQPVTAALIALSAAITSDPMYGEQSAAVLIAALPTLLVYLFGGRYFLRGLTAGAVK